MTDQFIGHYKLWEGYKNKNTPLGPKWSKPFDVFITPPTPKQSNEELEEMTDPTGHKEKRKRPKDKQEDKVNHPSHYGGDTPYETIKVLEAKLTYDEFIGFCKGNAIKYLDRAKGKGNEIQDYAKAVWYLNRMNTFIERIHNEINHT